MESREIICSPFHAFESPFLILGTSNETLLEWTAFELTCLIPSFSTDLSRGLFAWSKLTHLDFLTLLFNKSRGALPFTEEHVPFKYNIFLYISHGIGVWRQCGWWREWECVCQCAQIPEVEPASSIGWKLELSLKLVFKIVWTHNWKCGEKSVCWVC